MAVTRINNNQITDASAGNVLLGINANTKLQNYSITAGKIANNLTYGSDLTVAGNLTVQGNSTAIDTTIVTIEDPIILLASTATGAPAVDIGFIGDRGDETNIAFVWDESAGTFVTVFTTSNITTTTVAIDSYANFATGSANVTGNIVVGGTSSLVGNLIGAVNATANITGGNLLTAGLVSATGNIISGANITGANILTGGIVSATSTITGGNILTDGNVSATGTATAGNVATGGTVSATSTITGGNIATGGTVSAAGNITAGSGSFFLGNGSQLTGVAASSVNANALIGNTLSPNVIFSSLTTVGTLTSLSVSGTTQSGNLQTAGLISATGNVTAGNVNTGGNVSATGEITGGNVFTGGLISATGDITGGSLTTSGTANVTGTITGGNIQSNGFLSAVGTATVGNLATAGTASAGGNVTGANILTGGTVSATGTVTAGNVATGGTVSATATITGGNIATGGTVSATGNITGANVLINGLISATGTATVGNINTGGTASVGGNVTGGNILTGGVVSATGTATAGNIVTSGTVSATGTATAGNLATGGTVSATSTITGGNIATGGTVSATSNITGGNVATGGTVSAVGNITAGSGSFFIGNGSQLTGVVASSANAETLTGTFLANNVVGSSLTSVGVLSNLSVAGNTVSGNFATGNTISAGGNITGGNLLFGSGVVSGTGNITGGNLNAPQVYGATTLTLRAGAGNLNLETTGNVVLANTYINGLQLNPVQDADAASKYYVDNMVSTAISFHQAVFVSTNTTLETATGGTVTYAQPNGAANGIGATLTTTGSFNLIDTGNVQTVGTRILVKDQANAVQNGVYVWSNATVITRAADEDTAGTGNAFALGLNDYFFTTSGNVNAGSAFIVDAPTTPIVFGTSNIQFAQFSSTQVYSANTSAGLSLTGTVFSAKVDNNTTAFDGLGNISVKAGANLTTPNIGAATGTSLSTTGTVTGGNIATGGTVSATATITAGNIATGGTVSSAGNITAGAGSFFLGDGSQLTGVAASSVNAGNLIGNTLSPNVTFSSLTSVGNLTTLSVVGTTQTGNLQTAGLVSATGTVTAGNIATGGTVSAGGDVTGANILTGGTVSATGTATAGNVATGGTVSATATITGGNLATGGTVSATATITGGNLATGGTVSAAGNITGANVLTGGIISATGTATAGNLATGGTVSATGNISSGGTVSATGTVTGGNVFTGGLISATGTATVGNLATGGTVSATGEITGANIITGGLITSTGNITGGNILTGGLVSSTGTVTGGNLQTGGTASVTGTATVGNLATGGTVSATATITGGNIATGGTVSAGGNVTGANILTAGNVSATGNVIAANFIGNISGNISAPGANTQVEFNDNGTTNATSGFTFDKTSNLVTVGGNVNASNFNGNVFGTSVSASGTVTAASTVGGVITGSSASVTGTVTGGNVQTGGTVSATGNIIAGNISTAGQLQGGNIVISGDDITDTNGRVNFNTAGGDVDFAVNGDTVANVFYVDAGTGTASFGSATQTINAIVAFNSTNSILTPVGNTAQRPAVGVTGMVRFNTTNNNLELYDNSQWTAVGVPEFTVITNEQFFGDGSQVAFTLNSTQTTNSCIVSINGVVQIPITAYSVSGTDPTCVLTFTEAPAQGDAIEVRQITTTTSVTSISNSSGNAVVGVSDTAAQVNVTGDLSVTGSILGGNINSTAITSGTSNMSIVSSGGNIRGNVAGTTVMTISPGLVDIVGNLSVSGNATLSGNILGDRIQNGTTSIDIQTPSGNANISIGGTSNVAVFATTGAFITGLASVTGNITGGNLLLSGAIEDSGQLDIRTTASNGNIVLTPNGTGAIVVNKDIVNGQANGVGNIGSSSTRFNQVFALASSAQYADLAEKYTADAAYAPGTVVVFGGTAEVTVDAVDSDRRVAGIVSTNPAYIMNDGLAATFVATVALTGRVPCQVVGTVRKGDMMVAAGLGRARAEADPRVGTVIGKALEDFDGTEGTIEVVVGRF